ncbi:MAG TPA: hypothetical protein VH414_15945 [Lichenihabitans sp.]|jgi:hypothetical protein|nr:hypothetical protein [Lichenihabitans sp.]
MRRPNRHIEIFSISALDLFASALGAFILVAIILFPYYMKDKKTAAELAATQAELSKAQAEAKQDEMAAKAAEAKLQAQQAQMAPMQAKASDDAARIAALQAELDRFKTAVSKPFLVVGIKWTVPGADVDLHVTDPAGDEFYWFKNNEGRRDYPRSGAELSYDMTSGPAVELWQDAAAVPGEYKIDYVANALPEGYDVEVKGSIFDRSGKRDLPAQTLHKAKERVHAATLVVNPDGSVAIR